MSLRGGLRCDSIEIPTKQSPFKRHIHRNKFYPYNTGLLRSARNDMKGNLMGFLKNLFSGATAKPPKRYYTFHVKCNRCGEVIEGRIDLDNDLSLNDEGNGYLVRKGLMGSNRCFQQIEVELTFDSSRQLTEKAITGGTFVE
jgi:hypothetical protein